MQGSSLRDSTWDLADLTNARADKHTNFAGASLEAAVGMSSQWQQMVYMARCAAATWHARPPELPACAPSRDVHQICPCLLPTRPGIISKRRSRRRRSYSYNGRSLGASRPSPRTT